MQTASAAVSTSALFPFDAPGMTDTSIIICLLLAIGFGALVMLVIKLSDTPLDCVFDKNVDLKHYAPAPARGHGMPVLIIACIVSLIGITSWAAQRTDLAKAEERRAQVAAAPARAENPLKVTINRHKVVEIESGKCYAVANVARGTTYQTCVD
jgi:hypothetical protein